MFWNINIRKSARIVYRFPENEKRKKEKIFIKLKIEAKIFRNR